MPYYLDVHINYTKAFICFTRFSSLSRPREMLVMNCKILLHHPNWMHKYYIFPIIILASLLFMLQINYSNKGNSRKKPRIAWQDLVEKNPILTFRYKKLNPHITAYKSLLAINKITGQKQQQNN